jgi:hypothetical protein
MRFSKTSEERKIYYKMNQSSEIQWRDQHVIALHAFINE